MSAVSETSLSTPWHRTSWAQSIGYVLFVILGLPAAANAGHTSMAYAAVELPIYLLIFGTIGWVIARARKLDRTWRQVVFGRTAVITTLVLVLLAGIGATSAEAGTVGDRTLKAQIARHVDPGMTRIAIECGNAPNFGRLCAASYKDGAHHRMIIAFATPVIASYRAPIARAYKAKLEGAGAGVATPRWSDGYRTLVIDFRGDN